VAVEKLALEKSAEIRSRQNALQTIFSVFGYISGQPFSIDSWRNRLFQHPQHLSQVRAAIGSPVLDLPGVSLHYDLPLIGVDKQDFTTDPVAVGGTKPAK